MLSCFQNVKQLVIFLKISHSVIKNFLHSPFFFFNYESNGNFCRFLSKGYNIFLVLINSGRHSFLGTE